jgi:hypothetical protein
MAQPFRDDEFTSYLLSGLDKDIDALVEVVGARASTDSMLIRDIYAHILNTKQRMEAR